MTGTTYTLTVVNNSSHFADFCVYQRSPDLGVRDALSLAWLAVPLWPTTVEVFTWQIDYSFVWSQTGVLKPGVRFGASQAWPADPGDTNANQVLFDYQQGAFTFQPGAAAGTPQRGGLYVRELADIPADTASVGIGMSGSGTFAVQAQPNENLVFTPHPTYWVAAGTFEQGVALDVEEISNTAQVPFDSTFAMTAVLDARNNWTVRAS
ncbi:MULTISPECIES: hypothetical protein [unclassified Kutzneria]|uniref:hypothetical protein n=1 Tax=unclassified Kutzneria TaxID=2621979 RepID=UPI0004B2BCEF|nr:hypothetical protein [Kutzneria sp. 744]